MAFFKSFWFFVICLFIKLFYPSRWVGGAVIFRPDALGDFVIWMKNGGIDQTEYLRKKHGKVVLICNELYLDLAVNTNIWDEVVGINVNRSQTNMFYFTRLMLVAKRYSCDLLLNPRVSRVVRLDEFFAFCNKSHNSMCPVGYSFSTACQLSKGPFSFYSQHFNWQIREQAHQTAFDQSITEALTGYKYADQKIDEWLAKQQDIDEKPYIVIAPGAGNSKREWPAFRFADIAMRIIHKSEFDIVFVGGRADSEKLFKFLPRTHTRINNLCGKTSTVELVRIIQNSSMLVCNESGPLHVAYLTRTPAIAIAGGGHFGWFVPYPDEVSHDWSMKIVYEEMECFGCNWSCLYPTSDGVFPCIKDVSLDRVDREIDVLLESLP